MNKITEFINDTKQKIIIYDKYIYVFNYNSINSISSNGILISLKNKNIFFTGINLSIKKLTKEELLISGEVKEIKVG